MKKLALAISITLILGWLFSACATAPTDDMNRAQDALIRAENDANVVTYANNTLLQARDALARMYSEADAKRYDSARSLAVEVINHTERAIADGRIGADWARGEAENALRIIGDLLEETSNAVNAARQVQNIQLDFDSISREMDVARRAYDETWQILQAGNYRDVTSRGQIIRSILSDINNRLTEAVQATSRK